MNQPNRRSLTAALETADLPPEALELITAGAPQSRSIAVRELNTPPKPELSDVVAEKAEANSGQKMGASRRAPLRVSRPKAVQPAPADSVGSVGSITVRLPGDLPQELLRASLERKLRRIRPFTQQEIVASALREWLNAHAGDFEE